MVSIIMPCYNAGKYIQEAIESVQAQTYTDWELLVVDDGSTDDSAAVVTRMAEHDERIHLIKQPNSGACRARNNGIEHAHGEYVKFLDADDLLFPEALERQVEQIMTLAPRQIPFGDYDNIDADGKLISKFHFDGQQRLTSDPVEFFFSEWRVLITCPLHRTSILRELGGFNEQLMRGQESDLHLRLALADVEWVYYPTKLFSYRDYVAEQRISCTAPDKTRKRVLYWEQRMQICEQLFINKYGSIPPKYRTYFRDGWFNKARREFSEKQLAKGLDAIGKLQSYSPLTKFQKWYVSCGNLMGFVALEKIFRIRLRLLGK